MMSKTAFVYGARGPTFLSGSPYYFARALEAYGEARNAFRVVDLPPRRTRELPITFATWCLSSGSRRNTLFLLSKERHDASGRGLIFPASTLPYVIAFTQCVPENILACRRNRPESRLIYYLDATLLDLFETFDYARNPPAGLQQKMLRDELNGYQLADLLVVFHDGVRNRLVADYRVDSSKVWVLGRGVNLDPGRAVSAQSPLRDSQNARLRMMVVGRGPRRKGVFKLIEAIDALEPDEQSKLVLTIAGPKVRELPQRQYLRRLGFIAAHERDHLIAEMQASNLGVLLSEAEGYPGSIWEFLSLGVPVWVSRLPYLAPALQGYPVMFEDLPLTRPALVSRLRSFLHDPQTLSSLRNSDHTSAAEALTWTRPGAQLGEYIINH